MTKLSIQRAILALTVSSMCFLGTARAPLTGRTVRGAQELVPAGHWIYDAVTALSLESHVANFMDNAPLTIQEIQTALQEIDYDALSVAGKTQYDRIHAYFSETMISFASDVLALGIEPAVNVQGFYKTNDDIDWVFNRYQRLSTIDMPVSLSCMDYFSMKMDIGLKQNKGASLHDDTYTNIPLAGNEIDVNFPSYGYLSAGLKFTEKSGAGFQLALGPQSIGRSVNGSIIMSEYLTGTTTGKISVYTPNIKYTGSITELNVDKFYYLHEVDTRFFNTLTFSIMEGVLVYAPMELRFMNPFTIFHGFSPWRDYGDHAGNLNDDDPESHMCEFMGVKLQFVPVQGLRLYGLFAMTQYQTPYEKQHWGDGVTPDGLGGQLGTEAYIPFGNGYVHFALEGYYAEPFLYIKEGPDWTMVRTYSENMGDKAIFYEWVGSPFGPDTISGELTAGYEEPGRFAVQLSYLFMARGEMSGTSVFERMAWGGQIRDYDSWKDDWVYPDNQPDAHDRKNWVTPTGVPEYVNRLAVRASWYAKPWLKLTTQPAYVCSFNHNHEAHKTAQGFEIALSVECSFFRF